MFPYHTLSDNILFRKAKIETTRNNYVLAAGYFEQIINDYSYESLADDALFELATLYNFHLNEKEKARDLYKQMLFDFPGSVYVEESRTLYRELRELYPEEKIDREIPLEDLFMNGIIPNEIN
jgi:TolA-binding protein